MQVSYLLGGEAKNARNLLKGVVVKVVEDDQEPFAARQIVNQVLHPFPRDAQKRAVGRGSRLSDLFNYPLYRLLEPDLRAHEFQLAKRWDEVQELASEEEHGNDHRRRPCEGAGHLCGEGESVHEANDNRPRPGHRRYNFLPVREPPERRRSGWLGLRQRDPRTTMRRLRGPNGQANRVHRYV